MSSRTLSQLTYTRFQDPAPVANAPTIITLHGHNRRGRDYGDYARAAAPNGRLLGLESYKGVFADRDIIGFTWYPGPLTMPPPIFFGDALAEIERFLWDEVDRRRPHDAVLPILLGVEQGAIMAIAAALAAPDLLSGVIAIEGRLPIVPGWNPPLAPMNDLPILIVDPDSGIEPAPNVLTGQDLIERLNGWGARATRATTPGNAVPSALLADWVAAQEIRIKPASRN